VEGQVVFVAVTHEKSPKYEREDFSMYRSGFVVEGPNGNLQHFAEAKYQVKLLEKSGGESAA